MSKEQLSVGNSIKALALINIQDIFRFTITAKKFLKLLEQWDKAGGGDGDIVS